VSLGGKQSLAEQAYDELERRIVTLELPPGQLLLEQGLVDLLGLGRTPVREAVQRLAAHGLLRIYPRKGIQVVPVEARSMARVLEARKVLERLLVVKAAERADAATRAELVLLAGELERVTDDPQGFFRLDRRLDELLSLACDNEYLVQALAPLRAHCRRLWSLFRSDPDTGKAASLHAELARAVADDAGAGAIGALNGIISLLESFQRTLAART
jgi:DNA-binding GntR family transcriptional regulator